MMPRRHPAVVLLLWFLLAPGGTFSQQPAQNASAQPAAQQQPAQQTPAKDPNDPIERIKDEGMNRSQVMQTLSYLSDVIGPRYMKRANEWTRDQLTKWGLE